MSLSGKYFTVAIAASLSGAAMVPSSTSFASPAPVTAATEAPTAPISQAPVVATAPAEAPQVIEAPLPAAEPVADEEPAPAPAERPVRTASNEVDSELECLAKVVLHEAGNQSRAGQAAVAEVVMNRLRSPRFPKTICGVVLQRGQFFNVHAYRPHRDARWPRAVEIARAVRDGDAQGVANGAFFFRASHGASFPGRTRVATIGDHAFYR
jgi:spore germination cell wall hydrolase CwlJ-like protein